MKKIVGLVLIASLLVNCESRTGDMIVSGNIQGLKKGTLYLQKYVDTLIVDVDSLEIDGESIFTLYNNIDSPEVYYLTLDKNNEHRISFFGEKGTITINSKLEKFDLSAEITGSKNQEVLDEYYEMLTNFNNKKLDIIKEKLEAKQNKDDELVEELQEQEDKLEKRKYLYSANYAVNNADFEAAPYIALTELFYANVKLLDTINNSLTPKVKNSKYGKELEKFIKNIKETEKESN